MLARPLLSEDRKTDHVNAKIAEFHADIVEAVRRAVEGTDVVVVGMAQNPFVKKARAALTDAGIEFDYLEYGSYLSQWKERLAIKLWSGWSTFPQVFVRGSLIGGNQETRKALEDGSLRAMLERDAA